MKPECKFRSGDRVVFVGPHDDVPVGATGEVVTPAFLYSAGRGFVIRLRLDSKHLMIGSWPPEDALDFIETEMEDTRSYLAAVTEGV